MSEMHAEKMSQHAKCVLTSQVRDVAFLWGTDEADNVIREGEGQMNSVSEGHQSDCQRKTRIMTMASLCLGRKNDLNLFCTIHSFEPFIHKSSKSSPIP